MIFGRGRAWRLGVAAVRGESFSPLYPSQAVIRAVLADPAMYDATALVDSIRGGSARERQVATELLEQLVTRRKRCPATSWPGTPVRLARNTCKQYNSA